MLSKELGGKSKKYIHYIDSVSSSTNDPVLELDKGYCTSIDFYERRDYVKLDRALMAALLMNKMRIIKGGHSYVLNNCKITERKTRICNIPTGAVTGKNWVIKDANNKIKIAELNKSKTRHAYRMVSCF